MGRQGIAGHEFGDVDRIGRTGEFVRYLDERGSLDAMQHAERQMIERLGVRPGGRYLDVGCGTGDDVRGLARLVGPDGAVVGVDSSTAMIGEARRRAEGGNLPVAFHQGDAHHLEFADGTFDGCRIRRVLQHLADPQQAVLEMARVTRSGGHVAAFEPDWGTLAVDASDRAVTRTVLETRCDSMRNGWIGRELYRLFRRAGLIEITVEAVAFIETDHARGMEIFEIDSYARRAQASGFVTAEALSTWLAQLAQAGQEGTFFASLTTFVVSARKP